MSEKLKDDGVSVKGLPDSTPINFEYVPSKSISAEEMDDIALNGSSFLDKNTPSDEEFAKVLEKMNSVKGAVGAEAPETEQSLDDMLGLVDTSNLDNLMKDQDSRETSVLLSDPTVKEATVKEYDAIMRNFAVGFAQTEQTFREFGLVDENGEAIPEEERVIRIPGQEEPVLDNRSKEPILEVSKTNDNNHGQEILKKEIRKKGVLDPNSISNLEKYKNRRKRGYSVAGLLPNSEQMLRAYPMDTSLKKQDLLEGFNFAQKTLMHNERTFRMIYDHSSIISSDGANITYDDFMEIIHMDDLDDLLMLHLIAGTKGGKLSGIGMNCNSTEKGACLVESWSHDLDVASIYEDNNRNCDAYMEKLRRFNRLNTAKENLKISKIDEIVSLSIQDHDKGDTLRIEFSRASIGKYFRRIDKVKEALIAIMMKEELVLNYIDTIEGWDIQPLDGKLLILASANDPNIRQSYGANVIKAHIFVMMDKIEIVPTELLQDTTMENLKDHPDYMVVDMDNDTVELWLEFSYDITDEMAKPINELVNSLGESLVRTFKYKGICPKCAKETKEQTFSPTDVFLYWIGKSSV